MNRMRVRSRRLAGVEARLVWILGSPRSGSTWLANMLGASPRVVLIEEPSIGAHLGLGMSEFVSMAPRRIPVERLRLADARAALPSYFFSRRYTNSWLPGLRRLLLD